MTDLRQAAQQALEALEEATTYTSCPTWSPSMTKECETAAATLRSALEQQQSLQLHEVWSVSNGKTFSMLFATKDAAQTFCASQPLSAGLWPERISVLGSPQPEQQAEPVHKDICALKYRIHELEGEVMGYKRMLNVAEAASQRKPLTIEEINALPEAKGYWPIGMNDRIVRLIRAIEAAHNIKEGA